MFDFILNFKRLIVFVIKNKIKKVYQSCTIKLLHNKQLYFTKSDRAARKLAVQLDCHGTVDMSIKLVLRAKNNYRNDHYN